jgi:hypothetical protein
MPVCLGCRGRGHAQAFVPITEHDDPVYNGRHKVSGVLVEHAPSTIPKIGPKPGGNQMKVLRVFCAECNGYGYTKESE